MKKALCAVAVVAFSGVCAGVSAQGIESSAGFGIELGGGYYVPDVDRDLDNGGFGAFGLEYRWNEHWAVNGWFLQTEKLGMDGFGEDGIPRGDATIRNGHIDLTYYFLNGRWQPYVAFGGGRSNIDYDISGIDRQNQYNLGLGVKLHMTPGWFLRGEIRGYNGTGSHTDGSALLSVGYMFGQKAKVYDADGDGVADGSDRCPNTPAGVVVDSVGCPLDGDGDGVPDYMDECPDTPAGLEVDASGCGVVVEAAVLTQTIEMELDIKAAFNSTDIGAAGRSEVQKLAEMMLQYPTASVVIEGHTDSSGPSAYNQKLSEERAAKVANMLTDDFNIDPARISAVGYGEDQPIADNATHEGREENRRIMAVMAAEVEEVEVEEIVE